MNKEWLYVDGNVIVNDDIEGMQPPRKYSDNIAAILTQENIVKFIEEKLSIYKQNLINLRGERQPTKKVIKGALLFVGGAFVVASLLITVMLGTINTAIDPGQPAMPWKVIFGISGVFSGIVALGSTALIGGELHNNKQIIKEQKGSTSAVKFLDKELPVQRKILVNLQNDDTRDKEEELINNGFLTPDAKLINDKEELEYLKQHLLLFYWAGVKEKQYLKWYKHGVLKAKLTSQYTEAGIKIIENYLDELLKEQPEKGHQKVKQKEKQF